MTPALLDVFYRNAKAKTSNAPIDANASNDDLCIFSQNNLPIWIERELHFRHQKINKMVLPFRRTRDI